MQPPNYVVTLAQYVQYHLLQGEDPATVNANMQALHPGLSGQVYYQAFVLAQQGITATTSIQELGPDQRLNQASTRRPRPVGPVWLRFLAEFEGEGGRTVFHTVDVQVMWTDTVTEATEHAAEVVEETMDTGGSAAGMELISVTLVPSIYT